MISSGSMVFADRGRAAQIGKPQHGLDALGHAPRDAPAQHLLGSVAPEIDPAQRAGDIDLGGGLDRQPQHRHEVAQRRQALLAEAVGAPGQPVGIDAIHLADGSGFAKAMHEGQEMPVAVCGELIDQREIERCAIGEIDLEFVMAVFEHVIEGGAAPVLRGMALAGRSILEGVALVGFGVVPAKSAALENRVQRIDEDEAARQVETACPAALAEAADQIGLGHAGQALAHQPVHQLQSGREFHEILCRGIMHDERLAGGWGRRGRDSDLRALRQD